MTASFDPTQIFAAFDMTAVDTAGFDAAINAQGDDLRCVFLWGNDCFNCDIFKKTALANQDAIQALGLSWYHANVYEDEALGRRFGLHGVPAFFLFRSGKKLGRVTGWPGLPAFRQAIEKLEADYQASKSR